MNDTHGETGKGWYGFDLDGTLAKYDKWDGIGHIGEPVEPMVDLIRKMHDEGKVVKILTARVAPRSNIEIRSNPYPTDQAVYDAIGRDNEERYRDIYRAPKWTAREFVSDWCLKNLGFIPEIVYQKDHLMLELYDDRVKQVVPNEGLLVEDLYRECGEMLKEAHSDNGWLLARLRLKFTGFLSGLWIGAISAMLAVAGVKAYDKWFGPEKEPARVRLENAHKAINDLLNDWPEGVR